MGDRHSIGDLRFAAPQPADPWEGVRDATSHGKEPVQRDEQRLPFQVPRGDGIDADGLPDYMSEDSLTLNVYTPSQPGPAPGPLPVLFYIYGGGFNNGAGSLPMYDGTAPLHPTHERPCSPRPPREGLVRALDGAAGRARDHRRDPAKVSLLTTD